MCEHVCASACAPRNGFAEPFSGARTASGIAADLAVDGRRTPPEARSKLSEQGRGRAARTCTDEMAVTLPGTPSHRPDRGPARGAASSWRSSSSKAACRCPARWCRPGTRTARCRSSPRASSPRSEVVVRNVPRIRDVDAMLEILRAHRRRRSPGAGRTRSPLCAAEVARGRDRPRARRADPRLVPARRAAARALSPRRHAAAGRRRDRPPPPRPAPRRVPRDGRARRLRRRDRARAHRAACARPTCSWTSRR